MSRRAGPFTDTRTAGDTQSVAEAPLEERIVAAIRRIYDPEISVNIYDLGLIYDVHIDAGGEVRVTMTLTSPACPVAGQLPLQVEQAVAQVDGVTAAEVKLVFDPPWTAERISEAGRLELGLI